MTKMMITATTKRMWMNPPMVALVTKPKSQRTIRMIAIVINIRMNFFLRLRFDFEEAKVRNKQCLLRTSLERRVRTSVQRC